MSFGHPKMLWLMAVSLPLLALFLWHSWRRRQYLISQFVQSRLLAHLTVGLSRSAQKARLFLLVLAVGSLLLALAQPQWGFAWEEARQRGLDIMVAVDTSRSMLAQDVAPNRLDRAKLAILDLMKAAHNDRLGLVAFAGTAFLQCPLTLDDEAFRQSVNQLSVGIIPQGGTALAEAINTAQSAFKEEGVNHRVLVLFTDGEDHDSGALQAAEAASRAGLHIFTVGIGTPNGELLQQRDDQGNVSYIKDAEGNVVKSRLNQELLTEIATAADGFYLPLTGADPMEVLYKRGLAPLPKSEGASKFLRQAKERFQWPLGLAIVLLLLEVFLPDRRKVARSEAIATATNPDLRKVVALVAIGLGLISTRAWASPSSAYRKYEKGQYQDARQEYLRLLQRRPDDVRLQYDAGTAAYQTRNFEEAAHHFSVAATAPDLKLQERAYYNLGNSLFRVGEQNQAAQEKIASWEQATQHFESALKLDPKDRDAQYNLDFVKKKLEELKKQQQQSQKSSSNNQQDKKNEDQKNKDQKDQNKQQDQQKQQKQDQQQNSQSQPKDQKDQQPSSSQQPPQPEPEKKSQQPKPKKPDQPENASSQNGSKEPKDAANESAQAAPAVPGQMTPEQARQLLDAQKNKEQVMIFIPPEKLKHSSSAFKDW